jgi:mono/diheme cytochrome c family protein
MKKLTTLFTIAAAALLIDAAVSTQSVHAQAAPNVTAGKAAFMHYGCYECHGTQGQGNFGSGPAIAPHPMPYANFLTYIRAPRGEMPPFDARVLPAADAQNIFAYLDTLPSGPAASSIAALALDTGNAGDVHTTPQLTHGRELYGDYCIKCHGAAPIGPSLANVKAHMSIAATLAQIKNPAPPMPKLYPAPLSEADVNDVAAYVQTL